MINKLILLLFIIIGLCACQSTPNSTALDKTVAQYIEVFQKRQDFEQLLSFYAPDAQLEDMLYGHSAVGSQAIAKFYDWPNNKLTVLDGKPLFSVDQQVVDSQKKVAVFSGVFHRFLYFGNELGPWRFLIKLQFNEQGEIIYQQDWINYTPRSLIKESKNLNVPVQADD
ncbi:nuclear transport factor 2 family protein [Pseudoalteromonas sp. JBTF-M23]|uniref:Nuclear transport factor 2 family protein n=1 Tax=Pseudoalteromonas caenipelagi TaxID=2726988 RepID=A0A849VGR0_9GAMM|nr:nuclear transport factor 2 family protein [Pseudoalteromonas caenipelagi]NOU51990.1 nuclear transport factor 2 family protein [Pseudoalteromonas caenipelagi]